MKRNLQTTLQEFGYSFDAATGNLNYRKDLKRNMTETFGYDEYNENKIEII